MADTHTHKTYNQMGASTKLLYVGPG